MDLNFKKSDFFAFLLKIMIFSNPVTNRLIRALVKSGSADIVLGLGLALGIGIGLITGLGEGVTNKFLLNYSITHCDISRSAFHQWLTYHFQLVI